MLTGQHILSQFTKNVILIYKQMMIFIQQILQYPFTETSVTDKNLS